MLHKVVLVSAVRPCESAVCIHISPPSHPSPLGHLGALGRAPWAAQQLPTSRLFHTRLCVRVTAALSVLPTCPFPAMSTCAFSTSGSRVLPGTRFICTIFLGFTYMCEYMISIFSFLTYFTLFDRCGPSVSLPMTQFSSFLWLSNIPLYICALSY